ncbi:hypothetical protein Zmor_018143 [Zophobas morio]|mgnify:FL=1|uniref:PHD-type domain-containing protein n=1 Tax=Zophobas morio TaxID=2755281 RepID=A0AA38M9R0_9CUCU|nr:hypothetical protein Zmor_020216 [Zophobas morio]KAJ3652153.1 hypothetical protein Zmor_018143 [Zophobas morio]
MLPICGKCHAAIKSGRLVSLCYLTCSGTCGKQYHYKCADVPESLHEHLQSVPGLNWKCPECVKKCFCLDSDSLNEFLGAKFDELVGNLKDIFSNLKTELIESAERQIKDTLPECKPPVPSFSAILKNKTKPAIVIQPKNPEQDFNKTKSDIASNIDPLNANIQLEKVLSTKNGGILVGCSSVEQNSRFKLLAQEKLAETYVIREIKGVSPRVKLVGFSQAFEEAEWNDLADHMIKVNSSIFNPKSTCEILKFWPTKKKPKVYQALLQIDKTSYDRLMAAGGLFAGYDYCSAFEGLEANRCFNCNNFGHSSRVCKNKVTCPKCSCEHELRNCTSEHLKCINCVRLNEKNNSLVDTNHAVWDHCCPVYKSAFDKLKAEILSA